MLIAVLSFRRVSSDTGTTVRDRPSLTASSGHFGALSSLAHWPRWICAGWGTPEGRLDSRMTTFVLSPSGVSVAVPACPDWFIASRLTVIVSSSAGAGFENSPARACPEFCVNGSLAGNCRLVRRHNEHQETRRT